MSTGGPMLRCIGRSSGMPGRLTMCFWRGGTDAIGDRTGSCGLRLLVSQRCWSRAWRSTMRRWCPDRITRCGMRRSWLSSLRRGLGASSLRRFRWRSRTGGRRRVGDSRRCLGWSGGRCLCGAGRFRFRRSGGSIWGGCRVGDRSGGVFHGRRWSGLTTTCASILGLAGISGLCLFRMKR
jgi:hypothetical protein